MARTHTESGGAITIEIPADPPLPPPSQFDALVGLSADEVVVDEVAEDEPEDETVYCSNCDIDIEDCGCITCGNCDDKVDHWCGDCDLCFGCCSCTTCYDCEGSYLGEDICDGELIAGHHHDTNLCHSCCADSKPQPIYCSSCDNEVELTDWCSLNIVCKACCCDDEDTPDNCPHTSSGKTSTYSGVIPWVSRGITITHIDIRAERRKVAADSDNWNQAWKKFWPIDNENIDPVQAMADFYLLDGIAGMVFNGSRHVRNDTGCQLIAEEARDVQAALVAHLDVNFQNYVDMAVGGEVRHHKAICPSVLDSSRPVAWADWKILRDKIGVDALVDAQELFMTMGRGGGIGGPRWATGAKLLHSRLTRKLDAHTFVDRVFTLQHNGGAFINKIGWATKNLPKWDISYCMTAVGPAHAASPTIFSILLLVASDQVQSLFRRWWRQTNIVHRHHAQPVVATPSIFDHGVVRDGSWATFSWELPLHRVEDETWTLEWFDSTNKIFGAFNKDGLVRPWLKDPLKRAYAVAMHYIGLHQGFVPEPYSVQAHDHRFMTWLASFAKPIDALHLIAAVTLVDAYDIDIDDPELEPHKAAVVAKLRQGKGGTKVNEDSLPADWWSAYQKTVTAEPLYSADIYESKAKLDKWAAVYITPTLSTAVTTDTWTYTTIKET